MIPKRNYWSELGWASIIVGLALALMALLAVDTHGQDRSIENVNIVRVGYWQVVSPDTITNHTSQDQAIERQLNLLLQGVEFNQIVIKPPLYEVRPTYGDIITPDTVFVESDPDTVFVESEPDTIYTPAETDTVWAYTERTLYADTLEGTEMVYWDIHESLRDLQWQLIEDHPDSTEFRIRIHGHTTANRIQIGSKCIGYDSTMTAIDDRVGMTLYPDSTGYVDGVTRDYVCHPPGGNASMNLWKTAHFDSTSILHRDYIDVAHVRSIGNN